MERRAALKNMGMVFGYAVATPTVLSVLQSCKEKLDWTPSFFTKDEGAIIHTLVDILLPKTDTPSATEVNVHVFIDQFANEVFPEEQANLMKMAFASFTDAVLSDSGKDSLADLDADDLTPVFTTYLKKRPEEVEEAHEEALEAYIEAIEQGESASLDSEVTRHLFANELRNMTIFAYRGSEFIGEEVLAYLPVPGQYVPCGDVNELSEGKAWSL